MTKDIINNIEVDECVKYDKEQYLSCNMHYCRCEEIPNCYFKQLKRAERENERLLEIINAKTLETVDIDSAFEIEKLKEQLQAKEQECEKWKKKKEENEYLKKQMRFWRNDSVNWQMRFFKVVDTKFENPKMFEKILSDPSMKRAADFTLWACQKLDILQEIIQEVKQYCQEQKDDTALKVLKIIENSVDNLIGFDFDLS